MQIRKGKPPGSGRLARTGVELSREARVRLAWMDFYRRCRNVAHTCRHFGISRQTFYRRFRRRPARREWGTACGAARSSPPSSNRLASSVDCICSCCRRARLNSTAPSNAPTAPTPRSSTKSRPAPWNAKTQSRTAALGKDLQHRPSSSSARLPNPAPIPTNLSPRKE